jgi:antitoxin ParD1/3/4
VDDWAWEMGAMSENGRLTISELVQLVAEVERVALVGEIGPTTEVVRAALRDWRTEQAVHIRCVEALKADIDAGLADVVARRVGNFDAAWIIERGRELLADRSGSA